MKNPVTSLKIEPRSEDFGILQAVLPECVEATVTELGKSALVSFFDGYKTAIEAELKAA